MLVVADNNRARRRGAGSGAPLAYGLPSLSVAPVAAWYPVLVVAGYTGPLYRLVKVSDSTTRDVFAAAGSHIPDYGAIDAWAAGSAVVVDIWYDQTGNGWHKTQTNAAMRPSLSATTARAGIRPIMYDTIIAASGIVNKQMDFGPITGLNRTPFGYHGVANNRASYEGRAFLSFLNSAAPTTPHLNMIFHEAIGTGTGSFGSFAVNGTALFRTGFRARNRPEIFSVRNVTSGASGRTLQVGTRTITTTGVTSVAMSDVATEGRSYSSAAESTFDSFGSVIWSSAPSVGDLTNMDNWANTLFTIPGAATRNLVYGGSSLIVAWRSTGNVTPADIFARAQGDDWQVWNMGLGGRSLASEATNYAANYAPLYNMLGTFTKNVLIVDAPSNDAGVYADQAAAEAAADTLYNTSLINATTGIVNLAQATGFSVVVPTIIPRTGWNTTTNYTEFFRLRWNANVIAGAVPNNYKVADRAGDSRLSDINDATYFDADKIHLTTAGYQVLASIDTAAILSA